MHSIKAVYDGINFNLIDPIPVEGKYEVIITFVEPVVMPKKPLSEVYGSLKNKIWIDDDFNDPVEEFREYME